MKKTGKALSLVLSLALVVSSLTMTFASAAASKTEYLPSDTTPTTIDLVNGKSGAASLTTLDAIPATVSAIPTSDHLNVATLNIAEVVHKSGDSLVTLNLGTDKKVTAKLNSDNAIGTETIAVRYTVEDYRYTNVSEKILFSYEKDYAITIHKLNSVSVDVTDLTTKNADGTPAFTGAVDQWIIDSSKTSTEPTSRLAKADAKKAFTQDTATKGVISTGDDTKFAAVGDYIIKVASDGGNTVTPADVTGNLTFTASAAVKAGNTSGYLTVGSATFYATPVKTVAKKGADATTKGDDAVLDTANTLVGYGKVPNTVKLTGDAYITTWRGATWAVAASNTVLNSETDTAKTAPTDTGALNITGCDVILTATTIMDKGTLGTVSGGFAFTMNSGSVAAIDGTTTATVNNGSVGGAIVATTEADVNGGSTGNIAAPTVKVNAVDEKVTTHTGIIAAATVVVDSDKAAVTTGAITKTGAPGSVEGGPADETTNAITISGSKTTVGAIDCDNYKTTVDLKGFNGTIATPQNTASCVLKTEADGDTNTAATVTGNVAFSTISAENGVLTIANSATADYVNGIGTIVIPAGALKVNKSIGTVSLKLSDPQLAVGATVLYAPAYVVYDGSFKTIGYTLDYDAVNSGTKSGLQPFKIKSVSFAQLTIAPVDTTSNKIAVGQKITYKVSAYPAGTSLPDGTAIKITFNGSSDNFDYTTTADTITIEAKKYEPLFNSLNKGTITATLVDKNDNSVEKFGYDKATYDVQLVEHPDVVYTSDTTGALPLKVGQQYTYKITSSNGTDPKFGFGTDGIAKIVKTSVSGNAYFYTVQGVKEGQAGAYCTADKTKVNVVTVKGSLYTSDTTVVTVKTGNAYTFKITADKGASAPVFQVCTFNSSKNSKETVLVSTVKNANGTTDYFYKIVATNSPKGAHGAYVNGVKVATVTVA